MTRAIEKQVINELAADAEVIGRRAALKIVRTDVRTEDALTVDGVAEIVEAEVRSSAGLEGEGDVVIRLSYAEAVQAVTAIVEAMGPGRSASERDTLAELREKFFLALGIAPSARMNRPNARSS